MRQLLIAAAIALSAAATPSVASEVFKGSAALDKTEATYVRHTREHRMWEIQRNMEWQDRRRGYDGYRGHGYRRHHGPPPWAPAYGRRYDRERYYDRF